MASGQRTISIRFDGSAKGLVSSAAAVAAALKTVGEDTSGFKKAEAEADVLSKKLDQTAKDSREKGSLMGAGLALGLSGAAPLVGAALIGGVALGFVGVAGLVQKNNKDVKDSFGDLKSQVVGEMQGASDQVVPYLVKAGHSLQQEFANLGPQLRTAFKFAGPDLDIAVSGVEKLANNAMPGLVHSMQNSKPILQGVSNVLGDLGTTGSTVLVSLSDHSQEFGTDLDRTGSLIKNVGSVAAGVLPGLASGFGTSVGTVNTLLSALVPIAPAVGDITGELLPSVAAFKLFGLATSPLNKLGSKVAGVAGSFGGFTTKLTGSEKAGERVTTTTAKLGGALGKVGNSLPLIGAGFALADAGAQRLFGSADQLSNNLLNQTGPALQATEGRLASNDATAAALHTTLGGVGDFLSHTFIPTTKDVEAGLTSTQKAQLAYTEAVARFGAGSSQAATAQQALATANDADQRSQQRLNQSLLTTNESLATQQSNLLGVVNAGLGLQTSVLGVQSAQANYNSVLKNAKSSTVDVKQALLGLEQQQTSEVASAKAAADANTVGASANVRAHSETVAQTSAILGLVAASNGRLTPALKSMVVGLSATSVSAFAATQKVDGTHQSILRINGRTVRINVDGTGQAVSNAQAAKRALDKLTNRSVTITGSDQVTGVVNEIFRKNSGRVLHVNIDASGAEISQRAKGGPVTGGVPYVVGEVGKEIFVPQQSGRIIPNSQVVEATAGGGSGPGAGGPGASVDGDVVIMLDGEVLARVARSEIMKANRKVISKVKAGAGSR